MHFNPFSFEFVTNARKRERERASERETKRCMEERRNTIISPEGQGRVLYKFDYFRRKKKTVELISVSCKSVPNEENTIIRV